MFLRGEKNWNVEKEMRGGTATRVNLAVAGIAKSASASLLLASSALLGASGWRVRRLPLGDDESNEVLDEIIAACKLLAMIDATDETDPRREFLCAEALRRKANIHVTFEHEEVRVQEYKWRPEGARAKEKRKANKDANKHAIELYTPDPELASTWTIWTELSELKEKYTCVGTCEEEKQDRVKRIKAAHDDLANQQNLTAAQSDAKMIYTAKSSRAKSRENQTVHRLKAHTRTMPEFLTKAEETEMLTVANFDPPKKGDSTVTVDNVVRDGEIARDDTSENREKREAYFNALYKGRQTKVALGNLNANTVLDNYSSKLVGDQWQREVGGKTADLVKATENAKRMIVEVREAMEREEREESERKRTPKVKASALVVAVARGEQKQHWLLTYAKTIGDVWLEARGYSTVVRGHEVLVDFEKETDITPRPTTATHYVVPCVAEGARTVYHIPKTHTNGPLHTLSGGANVSPLYDVARRSISSLRDPSSVQKFTVVLGIESSFGVLANEPGQDTSELGQDTSELGQDTSDPSKRASKRKNKTGKGDNAKAEKTATAARSKAANADTEDDDSQSVEDYEVETDINKLIVQLDTDTRGITKRAREMAKGLGVSFYNYLSGIQDEKTNEGKAKKSVFELLARVDKVSDDTRNKIRDAVYTYILRYAGEQALTEGVAALENSIKDADTDRHLESVLFGDTLSPRKWTSDDDVDDKQAMRTLRKVYNLLQKKSAVCNSFVRPSNHDIRKIDWNVLKKAYQARIKAHSKKGTLIEFLRVANESGCAHLHMFGGEGQHILDLLQGDIAKDVLHEVSEWEWNGGNTYMPFHAYLFSVMSAVSEADPDACCAPLALFRNAQKRDGLFVYALDLASDLSSKSCTCHQDFLLRIDLTKLIEFAENRDPITNSKYKKDPKCANILSFFTTIIRPTDEQKKWIPLIGRKLNFTFEEKMTYLLWNVKTEDESIKASCQELVDDDTLRQMNPQHAVWLLFTYGYSESGGLEFPAHGAIKQLAADDWQSALRALATLMASEHRETLFYEIDTPSKEEWEGFISAYKPPLEIDMCIEVLLNHPKANEMLIKLDIVGLPGVTLEETLKMIRKGDGNGAKYLKALYESGVHPTLNQGALGANGTEILLHLAELEEAEEEEEEEVLEYIEEKTKDEHRELLYSFAEDVIGNTGKHKQHKYGALIQQMADDRRSKKFSGRMLRWIRGACNDALHAAISRDHNDTKDAIKRHCTVKEITSLDAKLALKHSDLQDASTSAAVVENTDLDISAIKKYVEDMKGQIDTKFSKNAIVLKRLLEIRNEDVTPKGLQKTSQILPFIHHSLVARFPRPLRAEYAKRMVEGGDIDKTSAYKELASGTGTKFGSPSAAPVVAHLRCMHWIQIANFITELTNVHNKKKDFLAYDFGALEEEFKASKEAHYGDMLLAFKSTSPSKASATKLLEFASKVFKGEAADIVNGVGTNFGEAYDDGVLRLDECVSVPILEKELENCNDTTSYMYKMIHLSIKARKARLSEMNTTDVDFPAGIMAGESALLANVGETQQKEAEKTVEGTLKNAKDFVVKFIAAHDAGAEGLRNYEKELRQEERDDAERKKYRVVRDVAAAYLRIQTDHFKRQGILRQILERLAKLDGSVVPSLLRSLPVLKQVSRQPSALLRHIDKLVQGEPDNIKQALAADDIRRSATLGDARKRAARREAGFGATDDDATALVRSFVKYVEEKLEIPKGDRLADATPIDDSTPIESNPSGFVDLAFREGGLYQLLDQTRDRGKWVRVLAGTYGVEEYYAPFAFTYSARAVYTESGANSTFKDATLTDKPSKNVHKGDVAYLQSISKMTRKRPSLGITVLDTRGANASVVGAMRVLAERARAASGSSSALWRLPCEPTSGASTCGSVVYVCCDFSDHDRAKKHWDIVTLVLDAELGRVLEKHVDSRFGHGERNAREIIADLRSAWDTVPQIKFEYKHIEPLVAQRHSDVKEQKEKRAKREKKEQVTVDAPELRLLHCFRHFVEANKESEEKPVYGLFSRMALPEAAEKEKMEEKWKKAISTAIGKLRAE